MVDKKNAQLNDLPDYDDD